MKTVILGIYGVIIKEARGHFIQFLADQMPSADPQTYPPQYRSVSQGKMAYADFMRSF